MKLSKDERQALKEFRELSKAQKIELIVLARTLTLMKSEPLALSSYPSRQSRDLESSV